MIYSNRPPHLPKDDSLYFITARTIGGTDFFKTDEAKQIFLDCLDRAREQLGFKITGWVVLNNHYHMLIKVIKAEHLSKIFYLLHSNSARLLNKLEDEIGRKVWWNYWEKLILDKEDFYSHLNYIHNNPIKHEYVDEFEKLHNYRWSSFGYYLKKNGWRGVSDMFANYPVIDFGKTVDG
ncbi:MAG: hypothetical protein A2445_00385 [Candidatus Jacksonbacteria bacterium RIFOXYC2_FULL_44_29]|nr:MAG: hypothetical protein A2445_00385 [Candidatus Jacksonbacteria bacterium RIFOXYC2_FULL_44_29]HBH46715.1 hypothetical protein [Candidatus Jacksonbacteria bacterium]HCC49911.1 hypothetical protein [Candidatus Jacksonbacteria bacterium]HCE48960.1 hypothetical protein [Candidatus Jacksonbacteria bacterium]